MIDRRQEMTGKIQVTVQTEERLRAITELAQAINKLADALSVGTQVTITDCRFSGHNIAVSVDTAEEVTETMVTEIDDDTIG